MVLSLLAGPVLLCFLTFTKRSLKFRSKRTKVYTPEIRFLLTFQYYHSGVQILFANRLIATKCPNNTIGTINVGNKLNGKYSMATFGCSKAIF